MTHLPTEPDFNLVSSVTIDDVLSAADVVGQHVVRTPVMTSRTIDGRTGASAMLKCENFQRVGAFKFRGALNAISRLPEDSGGVLAYSSGNHAQGVALASASAKRKAVIVMPNNAPKVKLEATRTYLERGGIDGSRVVMYDPETTRREELGIELAEREELTVIPPYDHPHVIAGQGTAALELVEDHGPLNVLFVCVGGGGLLSGCAIAAKGLAPDCQVIGIEPELADDATRSFRSRSLQTVTNPPTIADGARTPSLGRYTFPLVLTHVDEMRTVTEGEIRGAMRIAFERLKVVVEPAGALALAGLLKSNQEFESKRVGVIISGGNVDPAEFSKIITGDSH